jgi:thioredoxin reductase (NADPH)
MTESYDAIIIGAGPAGLAACIYSGRNGMRTVCLEGGISGGRIFEAPLIENYPGFQSISGKELVNRIKEQASKWAELKENNRVIKIEQDGDGKEFRVKCEKEEYQSKTIILCTGSMERRLNVKGEETFFGKGISYCATCDGFFFKGKKVMVVGGGNSAALSAVYLSDICSETILVHRRDQLRAERALLQKLAEKNVEIIWNSVVEEIKGDKLVKSVLIRDIASNKQKEIAVDGVFIQAGEIPNNDLAKKFGLDLDEEGYIRTDSRQRTNKKYVFAAGDITGGIKQVVVACSEGATAAITAYEDLVNPYWTKK